MVRKLSSSLRPIEQLPGLILYFASDRGRLRVFLEEEMPVVVEVADDGRRPALFGDTLDDIRHGFGGGVIVDSNADHLRPGAGKRGYLLDRALDIGGVGIGHRLHNDRCIRTDANAAYIHRYRTPTLDLWHKVSTVKFTIPDLRAPAIHYPRRPGSSDA